MFRERGARLLSGAIAFYSLLSIVPMVLVALRVAAIFADREHVESTLHDELGRWVGQDGAATLSTWIDGSRGLASHDGEHASFANLTSSLLLLYGATRLWSQMQRALDILWNTPPNTNGASSWQRQLRKRVLSLLVVCFVGASLAGLTAGQMLIARMHIWAETTFGTDERAPSTALAFLFSWLATVLLFFVVLKVMPSQPKALAPTFRGAMLTATLFNLGSLLVGKYVAHKASSSPYGAATTVVMLMLWVHYSAHAFFFGAAYTAVHAERSLGPPSTKPPPHV